MKKSTTFHLILAALFAALGVLLPSAFHAVGMSGSIFLPMHIPVLLCGLLLGAKYGILIGIIVPFASSIFTGMPPLYPVAVFMACELATYGAVTGLLAKQKSTLIALIAALLTGRIALGIAQFILLGLGGGSFGLSAFISSAFITALPGIVLQLILIPSIMYALKKARITEKLV